MLSTFASAVEVTSIETSKVTGVAPKVTLAVSVVGGGVADLNKELLATYIYKDDDGDEEESSEIIWKRNGSDILGNGSRFTIPADESWLADDISVYLTTKSKSPAFPDIGSASTGISIKAGDICKTLKAPAYSQSYPLTADYCQKQYGKNTMTEQLLIKYIKQCTRVQSIMDGSVVAGQLVKNGQAGALVGLGNVPFLYYKNGTLGSAAGNTMVFGVNQNSPAVWDGSVSAVVLCY